MPLKTGQGMTKATVDATRKGMNPSGNTGDGRRQGEVPGSGTLSSAVLNQRPNTSDPRNQGPSGTPSVIGSAEFPIVTMADRKTGRIM